MPVQNLVILPINTIGHILPQLLASLASLARISKFLQRDEKAAGLPVHPLTSSPTSEKTLSSDGLPEKELASPGEDLILTKASFAPEDGADVILREISSAIRYGAVTMLVGPVGSVSPARAQLFMCNADG